MPKTRPYCGDLRAWTGCGSCYSNHIKETSLPVCELAIVSNVNIDASAPCFSAFPCTNWTVSCLGVTPRCLVGRWRIANSVSKAEGLDDHWRCGPRAKWTIDDRITEGGRRSMVKAGAPASAKLGPSEPSMAINSRLLLK